MTDRFKVKILEQLSKLKKIPLILSRQSIKIGKSFNSWENPDNAYRIVVKEIQNL